MPRGTIRAATERRLVDKIGALPGFSTQPLDGSFWVTPPPNSTPKARRWVVIGTPDGTLRPEGNRAGQGPSVDEWLISCGIAVTDVLDPLEAKQVAEDALNAIGDMLAADHRLTMTPAPVIGVRDVQIAEIEGPHFAWESGGPALAWIDFDIAAAADIHRNPS